MSVRFLIDDTLTPLKGTVFYNSSDSAFDFEQSDDHQLMERVGANGLTSVIIGTLQIEVGVETAILLYVWGYEPVVAWKPGDLPPIQPRPAGVRVVLDDEEWPELELEISITLVETNEWPSVFDRRSGWFCIGNPYTDSYSQCIEFATDTVAVIKEDRLTAIWLRPTIR